MKDAAAAPALLGGHFQWGKTMNYHSCLLALALASTSAAALEIDIDRQKQDQAQGQAQRQGQAQGQRQIATGGDALAVSGSNSAAVSATRVRTVVGGQANTQSSSSTTTVGGQTTSVGGQTTEVGGQSSTVSMSYNEAPAPTTATVRTAPDVFVGGPASGPCTGTSGGASASWLGGGFGVNLASVSKDCDLREGLRVISMILPVLAGQERAEAQQTLMAFLARDSRECRRAGGQVI